jgi:hypothetical protein
MNTKPRFLLNVKEAKIQKPLRHGIHCAGASVNSENDNVVKYSIVKPYKTVLYFCNTGERLAYH